MAITSQQKIDYDKKVQPFLHNIKVFNKKNIDLNKQISSSQLNGNQFARVEFTLSLIDNTFYEISAYIAIVRLSQRFLKIQSEQYTKLARKKCHTYLQLWESMVGRMLDTALTDKTPLHHYLMSVLNNIELFEIYKKIGFIIDRLESLQGDTSKWKWTFVDIKSRLVTVMKNALNFKEIIQHTDPSHKDYKANTEILSSFKKFMQETSEEYRKKYELYNQNIEDMKKALSYINTYKRFLLFTGGDPDEMILLKKKHDTWKKKLDDDMNKVK